MSKTTKTIKTMTITLALVMAASVSMGIAAQRGTMMNQNTTTKTSQGYQQCPYDQSQNGNGGNQGMMNQRGGMMNGQNQRYANCQNNQQRGNLMNQGNGINQNNMMNQGNSIKN